MGELRRKGILLAGGQGTRLHPVTAAISKHLLPVYDKPLVYYPLSVLMLAGIRDILVISTPRHLPMFKDVLGDGGRFGISLQYAEQAEPRGIAEALLIAESFFRGNQLTLILGDNIFFGHSFSDLLDKAASQSSGATIFVYPVQDPERYGVAALNAEGRPLAIEEKPEHPKSNLAVTGLYFYDHHAPDIVRSLRPSARGELEITDLNNIYLNRGNLECMQMGRGSAWFDAGTCESLMNAAEFVRTLELRQGLQIACLEEVAFRLGYIGLEQLKQEARRQYASDYGRYLKTFAAQVDEEQSRQSNLNTEASIPLVEEQRLALLMQA